MQVSLKPIVATLTTEVNDAKREPVARGKRQHVEAKKRKVASAELQAELEVIVEKLSSSLTARGIHQWMEAPNPYLKGSTPLALLSKARYAEVREAVEAMDQGVFI